MIDPVRESFEVIGQDGQIDIRRKGISEESGASREGKVGRGTSSVSSSSTSTGETGEGVAFDNAGETAEGYTAAGQHGWT